MEAAQTSSGSVERKATVHSEATDSDTELAQELELVEHWQVGEDWRNSFVVAVGDVAEAPQKSRVVQMAAHQISGLGLKLQLRRADSQLRLQAVASSPYV